MIVSINSDMFLRLDVNVYMQISPKSLAPKLGSGIIRGLGFHVAI